MGHLSTSLAPEPGLLAHIGGTPLLRLTRLLRVDPALPAGVELHGKAEHLNPGGSLKDRPVKAMLLAGEASGRLTRERTILDATSGNTGISYAMLGAALGYGVALCLPASASAERKRMLRIYGARVIETDPGEGSDGARRRAAELYLRAGPEKYFYPDQYNNEANWRAHYEGTAEEIWAQTGGRVTHFLAGLGTSGTFIGTARRLKELNPGLQAISVQPDRPDHQLAGLKHMATAMVPGIYDPAVADRNVTVTTGEGWAMTRRLACEAGLLVGVSTGANLFAALRLAPSLPPGSVLVTVLFDSGGRYLSSPCWEAP